MLEQSKIYFNYRRTDEGKLGFVRPRDSINLAEVAAVGPPCPGSSVVWPRTTYDAVEIRSSVKLFKVNANVNVATFGCYREDPESHGEIMKRNGCFPAFPV